MGGFFADDLADLVAEEKASSSSELLLDSAWLFFLLNYFIGGPGAGNFVWGLGLWYGANA